MKVNTDEDFSLAGEYVLGMLDAAQEAVVAARIATDSRFTAEVEAWRRRLKPLLGPERPAPARIWPKIEKAQPAATLQDFGNAKLTFWRALKTMSVTAA
jgi:anti-sigma-K factor RskA